MKNPDEQAGYLLTQAAFLRQRVVNAALKELDVTYIQFVILAGTYELTAEGKVVTQQTISTERRLDKAMVSNVIKTLISKRLLIRKVHPEDKRAYTLSLTKAGTEKAIKGRMIASETDESFFRGIDKKTLSESLSRILKNDNEIYE